MGDESGESLDSIVHRKELERRASGGAFVWGIGNGLGHNVKSLLERQPEARVLFSRIKSPAAAHDRSPEGLLLWLDYVCDGGLKPLPAASFVTSRNSTKRSAKTTHYALFCESRESLVPRKLGELRFSELRNFTSEKPIGFSQVTAVVSRTSMPINGETAYEVVLSVKLTAPHFAKLSTPVALSSDDSLHVSEVAKTADPARWLSEIASMKSKYRGASEAQHRDSRLPLFA